MDHPKPEAPLVTFYRFIPGTREPMRADRAAAGTMPMRAYRFCEAMTTASAFGWYLFPPITFSLMWDGSSEVLWTYQGADGWYPLKVAQYPSFAEHFNAAAPPEAEGFSPPFLAAFKEPGIIQLWTGFVAKTAPGWNLLVRPPANLPHSNNYDFYEGVIETDRWFGPLFINFRLTRTHAPVEFDAEFPLLQVQPVHRSVCGEALDDFRVVSDLGQLSPDDWAAFQRTVVKPNIDPNRQRGQYAATTRRRRKREGTSATTANPHADPGSLVTSDND